MPLAVPRVSAEWGVPPADFSISLSAIVLGIGLAAVTIAPLGERIGRGRMIFWSGLFATIVTAASAFSHSTAAFTVWRFLTGVGLGACLPNVTATVVQLAPEHLRGRILAIVNTAIPMGSVTAGFLAAPLIDIGRWPMLFIFVALLAGFCTLALRFLLPKSHRRLAETGTETEASVSPVLTLYSTKHRLTTFLLLGLGTTNTFLIYMMINWLPTLLPRGGLSLDDAARMSSLFQLGGIVGGFGFAWMIDRGWATAAFIGGYAIATLGLVALALLGHAGPAWAILLLAVGVGISGAHVAITIFGVMFYPTELLSSYVGLSIAVTRIGAIGGPLAGGWLLSHSEGIGLFVFVSLVPVAFCVVWVWAIARWCNPVRIAK